MGHVIFALDMQVFMKISNVYGNLKKKKMKPALCICEALSYMHGTMELSCICRHGYPLPLISIMLIIISEENIVKGGTEDDGCTLPNLLYKFN